MTVRTTITKRNVFAISDDAPTFTDARKASRTVHVELTDYKGDLPLNPVPWLRIDTIERRHAADGRVIETVSTVMLNDAQRAELLRYLAK